MKRTILSSLAVLALPLLGTASCAGQAPDDLSPETRHKTFQEDPTKDPVQHPGAYRLERAMTVIQALSLGGGLTPKGTERGMRIKVSGELWDFSDFEDEIAAHVGVVANF